MADLRFIMDMPEPQSNKKDGDGATAPAQTRDQDSSRQAPPSYANPRQDHDRLISASSSSTRRRGSIHQSSNPSTPALSTSSSTRPALVRQQSTDSTDSMDPTGYGGQGLGSSSGNMAPTDVPIRPRANAPGSDAPVRFTPITGRVSRAKKGMPVHVCDLCIPPKVFTRAEHLRRHQLSHQTPKYPCQWPGCDRAFHRPDLLHRHAQKHEQETQKKDPSGDRRVSTASKDGFNSASPMYQLPNTGPAMDAQPMPPSSGPAYPTSISQYSPSGHIREKPISGSQNSSQQEGERSDYIFTPNDRMDIPSSSAMTDTGFVGYDRPRTDYPVYIVSQDLPESLSTLSIPDSTVPGLLMATEVSPWPSSASDFSTPEDTTQGRGLIRSYTSPTSDWNGAGGIVPSYQTGTSQELQSPGSGLEAVTTSPPYIMHHYSPSPQHFGQMVDVPMAFQDDHTAILEHAHHHQAYSPVRSMSPPTMLASAQTAENLVTASIPLPGTPPMVGRLKGAAPMGPLLGAAASLAALSLSRPVRNAIPEYLDLYWKRCDILFPLVHRRGAGSTGELLRCAMAAVATQFLPGKEDRIRGNQLHEFAWHEVKRVTQWSVQVMQTILLCEFYARFRGRKVVTRPSQQFRNLYSRVADSQLPTDPTPAAAATMTREERWDRWVEAESFRRLLAGCFIFDVHTSLYHEQPLSPQSSTATPRIPLVQYNDDLWRASTAESWDRLFSLSSPRRAMKGPAYLGEARPTPELVAGAPPMDRVVLLASEVLRLPRRLDTHSVDLSTDVDLSSSSSPAIGRIRGLFPASPIANTYLALHFTPLHDLLAVSGDSWLFSQKLLGAESFQQRQKRLRRWSGSRHAGAAARFAAEALLSFLNPDDEDENDDDDDHDGFPAASASTVTTITATIATGATTTTTCTTTKNASHAGGDPPDRAAETRGGEEKEEIKEEYNDNDVYDDSDEQDSDSNADGRQRRGRTRLHRKSQKQQLKHLGDISDYWSMYVCALICWALSHHAARQTAATTAARSRDSSVVPASAPPGNDYNNMIDTAVMGEGRGEIQGPRGAQVSGRRNGGGCRMKDRGALEWLRMVAQLEEPSNVLEVRGRAEAIGVVGLVGRRLEGEAAGGKSRLLVDALGVLKKLEEGVNWKWF